MIDFSKLKVVDLKAELKKRGLPQTGLKPALIERLRAAEAQNEARAQVAPPLPAPETSTAVASQGHPAVAPPILEPLLAVREERPAVEAVAHQSIEPPATEQSQEPQTAGEDAGPSDATASTEPPKLNGAHLPEPPLDAPLPDAPPHLPPSESADASMEVADAAEDSRKRKRRSLTPAPTVEVEVVTQKKAKHEEEGATVHFEEDEQDKPTAEALDAKDEAPAPEPAVQMAPPSERGHETKRTDEAGVDLSVPPTAPHSDAATPAPPSVKRRASSPKDARFQSLFASQQSNTAPTHDATAPGGAEEADPPSTPSIHPATSALYIRDFMRPLHPPTLRAHLVSLASPPGSSPDPDVLTIFHLDTIRTHALVTFGTVAAASRVRAALHLRVWPEERTRKPLWVDFVPDEKVPTWIEQENAAAVGRSGKRWEVVYDAADTKGDGDAADVIASLQEVGSSSHVDGRDLGAGRGVQGAPVGPRSQLVAAAAAAAAYDTSRGEAPRRAAGPDGPRAGLELGFSALDTHFQSTTAKPKLYFLPVAKDLADKRLHALARDAARPSDHRLGGRRGDELRRYTFEEGDVIVDRGAD
ncbi:MAG: hypothetical protein M1838_004280, partial [Thelocarpon superellum]